MNTNTNTNTNTTVTTTNEGNIMSIDTRTLAEALASPMGWPETSFRNAQLAELMHRDSDTRCALACITAPLSQFFATPAYFAATTTATPREKLALAMTMIADWDTSPMPPAEWMEKVDADYAGDVVHFLNAEILRG